MGSSREQSAKSAFHVLYVTAAKMYRPNDDEDYYLEPNAPGDQDESMSLPHPQGDEDETMY